MNTKNNTTLLKINEVKLILLRIFIFFGDYLTLRLYDKSVNVDRIILFREDLKKCIEIFNEIIEDINKEIV